MTDKTGLISGSIYLDEGESWEFAERQVDECILNALDIYPMHHIDLAFEVVATPAQITQGETRRLVQHLLVYIVERYPRLRACFVGVPDDDSITWKRATLDYEREQRWVERQGERLLYYHHRGYESNRWSVSALAGVVRLTAEGVEPDPSWRPSLRRRIRVAIARDGERIIFRAQSSDEVLFVARLVGAEGVEFDLDWAAAERAEREQFWKTWYHLVEDLELETPFPASETGWRRSIHKLFGFLNVGNDESPYDPFYPLPPGIRTEADMVEHLWGVANGNEWARNCGTKCRRALKGALQTREARLAASARPDSPGG